MGGDTPDPSPPLKVRKSRQGGEAETAAPTVLRPNPAFRRPAPGRSSPPPTPRTPGLIPAPPPPFPFLNPAAPLTLAQGIHVILRVEFLGPQLFEEQFPQDLVLTHLIQHHLFPLVSGHGLGPAGSDPASSHSLPPLAERRATGRPRARSPRPSPRQQRPGRPARRPRSRPPAPPPGISPRPRPLGAPDSPSAPSLDVAWCRGPPLDATGKGLSPRRPSGAGRDL